MGKKIALGLGLIYAVLGLAVVVSNYNCSGWVCNITSYLVATPWSRFWNAGGPLFLSVGELGKAILNSAGVLINSVIVFYLIKMIGLGLSKIRN